MVTLACVGGRVLLMMPIRQRCERLNRQISERLRTLIAAYKALGGSFTGELAVDPSHLRDHPNNRAELFFAAMSHPPRPARHVHATR